MDNDGTAANSTIPTDVDEYVNLAAYAVSGISCAGVVLIVLVLVAVARAGTGTRTRIDATVVHMLVITCVYGITMAFVNIQWTMDEDVITGDGLQTPLGLFLLLGGYFLVLLLFACNLRLALERLSLVCHSVPLQLTTVFCIMASPLPFLATLTASFCISTSANWVFWPLALPQRAPKIANILFLFGLLYIPLSCLCVAISYFHLYRTSVYAFAAARHDAAAPSTATPTPSIAGDTFSLHSHTRTTASSHLAYQLQSSQQMRKQERIVFVRCAVMSTGLVLLYLPTTAVVFCLVVRNLRNDAAQEYPDGSLWIYLVMNLLPGLDIVYTPALVLAFQPGFREACLQLWVEVCWVVKGRRNSRVLART
ncbi:hypothetical protein BC830DRAFT_1166310 [Chytriomyces sp. MP71]|nr:hypothetical protein BC830DRAFT_1166310 [Chytriomyces sp. MP71]